MSAKQADLPVRLRLRVLAFESLSRMVLGDVSGALACARRCACDSAVTGDVKAFGMIVMSRLGTGEVKSSAEAYLAETAAALADEASQGQQAGDEADMRAERAMARIWRASVLGPDMLASEWMSLREKEANDQLLCLAARWFFDAFHETLHETLEENTFVSFADAGVQASSIERYIRERIESPERPQIDYVTASAALSMERIHVAGISYTAGPLSTRVLLELRQVELSVLRQRQQFASEREGEPERRRSQPALPEGVLSSAPVPRMAVKAQRSVPVLELKMFGRFEASIGGVALDPKLFRRQNVRSLLVLLAINQGRELPRESIIHAMWPKSTEEVGRKNFYSVWSQLKRALSLTDGTCPYLVRHQYGCALEERFVQSDVARFGQICRELLFGRPDFQEWADIYTELDRDFANDLLPAETDNPLVISARNDFRSRLVDALVSATHSVVEAGNPQWGIWFARMAVSHDETREDAYVALMRAQIAGDQRTAAIMTFLKCQKVLADELGVDPSPETVALYESLL